MNSKVEQILLSLSYKYNSNWDRIYEAISNKEKLDDKDIAKYVVRNKDKFFTVVNPEYPEQLKSCYKPPFVLYYKGNISLLDETKRSVFLMTEDFENEKSKNTFLSICNSLDENTIIVIPYLNESLFLLAKNICKKHKVIFVLKKGLQVLNKKENELINEVSENGLVISEYISREKVTDQIAYMISRIGIALSTCCLYGETVKNQVTLGTVTLALNSRKLVFAIPTEYGSKFYNNELIERGATILYSEKQIEEEFQKNE